LTTVSLTSTCTSAKKEKKKKKRREEEEVVEEGGPSVAGSQRLPGRVILSH
jgi:hypothetical protein